MKNPFDVLLEDIFSATDFVETARLESSGEQIPVIASSIAESERFTAYGEERDVTFFLRMPLGSEHTEKFSFRRGDRITFRGEEYKIERTELDSAGRSWNVYLKR